MNIPVIPHFVPVGIALKFAQGRFESFGMCPGGYLFFTAPNNRIGTLK